MESGDFQQEYMPKLEKIVKVNTDKALSLKNTDADYRLFFADETTKTAYEDTRHEEASGTARQVNEKSPLPIINLNDGYVKRRQVLMYGGRAEYTKMVQMLHPSKLLGRISMMCANLPHQLVCEIVAAYVELGDLPLASIPLINGRPQIDSLAADGQPIFSTAHTFKSSAVNTYSNKTATFQSLTADTLYDSFEEINLWRNNEGDLLDVKPQKLIVGVRNEKKAVELCMSDEDSETANRSTNSLRRYLNSASFSVYKRMRTPTEWFIETNVENDYLLSWLWKPQITRGFDDKTLSHFINNDFAFSHGVGEPRRFYANKV